MLAQNFKTPAELGLTDDDFNSHVQVLGMLERQEMPHAHDCFSPPPGQSFNMALAFSKTRCGTVGCIYGWSKFFQGEPVSCVHTTGMTKARADLYCPEFEWVGPNPNILTLREQITTAQAAIALRNYLTHGEPRWEEALA